MSEDSKSISITPEEATTVPMSVAAQLEHAAIDFVSVTSTITRLDQPETPTSPQNENQFFGTHIREAKAIVKDWLEDR